MMSLIKGLRVATPQSSENLPSEHFHHRGAEKRRRYRWWKAAQSTVEFALALPVFLMMILGLTDLSRYMLIQSTMTHVIRTGLRYAITGQQMSSTDSNGNTVVSSLRQSIITYSTNNHPLIAMIPLTAGSAGAATGDNFIIQHSSDSGSSWQDLSSTLGLPDVSGDLIKITYTYNFQFITPFMTFLKSSTTGYTMSVSTFYQAEHF
ncbi:MAG: pilus assembly protein [Methylacidiphilales bacterium]|nr:pilus assembly protein [Candidatus Methylacidiphilales bacterium]